MYRDVDDHLFSDRTNYAGVPIRTAGRVAPFDQTFTSQSLAVFGEVTREFVDGQLELTAGLRYFEDDVAPCNVNSERSSSRLSSTQFTSSCLFDPSASIRSGNS
jgi:outer membrane receptor protein involved in Fe transport